MPIKVVLHILGAEPILADIDELPKPSDLLIKVNNPRKVDGKALNYINESVESVIWPIDKINFIEILPAEEDDNLIGFVRE